MYRYLCLVLLIPLASPQEVCTPSGNAPDTIVLLDTYNFERLLPAPWISFDQDGNDTMWEVRNNETCRQTVGTCSTDDQPQQNYLISPFVDISEQFVPGISIIVEFSEGGCPALDSCGTDFSLLIFPTSSPGQSTNISSYIGVVPVVPNNSTIFRSVEENGFYLAFRDESACVVIDRVRVFFGNCSENVNGFVRYSRTIGGQNSEGICVDNAVPVNNAPLSINCQFDGTFNYASSESCHCDSGYQADSTSDNTCTACPENTFKQQPGSGPCSVCPNNSRADTGSTVCDCNEGYSRADAGNTASACTVCNEGFYISGDGCSVCPDGSNSSARGSVSCMCNPGFMTPDGSLTTTGAQCDTCHADFYRSAGSCSACPQGSSRMLSTDMSMCICDSGLATQPDGTNTTTGQDCNAIIGFLSDATTIEEGLQNIGVGISVVAMEAITGSVSAVPNSLSQRSINFDESFSISTDTMESMITVTSADNDIALEGSITFTLELTAVSPSELVIGGSGLYRRTSVTIEDNDFVDVGFSENTVRYDQSTSSAMLTVRRNQNIGSTLNLTISGAANILSNTVVSLRSGDAPTVSIQIDVSGLGGRDVTLQLEYAGPPQFARFVRIGGGNTSMEVQLSQVPPESSGFPVEAIIGISAGGAGVAVLLLIVVIMCLCICRLRVNRQGFYHTYEDKVSEPPTMLRYSASLRSISSQTVIPVTEGKTVAKENEFYV